MVLIWAFIFLRSYLIMTLIKEFLGNIMSHLSKIFIVYFSLIISSSAFYVKEKILKDLIPTTYSSYKYLCKSSENLMPLSEKNFKNICKILAQSEVCSKISSEDKVDCLDFSQNELISDENQIDLFSSCFVGIFNFFKEIYGLLSESIKWIISDKTSISDGVEQVHSSMVNYLSIELEKSAKNYCKKEVYSSGQICKEAIAHSFHKVWVGIVENIQESILEIGCYRPEKRAEKLCQNLSEYIPLVAGPAYIFKKIFEKKSFSRERRDHKKFELFQKDLILNRKLSITYQNLLLKNQINKNDVLRLRDVTPSSEYEKNLLEKFFGENSLSNEDFIKLKKMSLEKRDEDLKAWLEMFGRGDGDDFVNTKKLATHDDNLSYMKAISELSSKTGGFTSLIMQNIHLKKLNDSVFVGKKNYVDALNNQYKSYVIDRIEKSRRKTDPYHHLYLCQKNKHNSFKSKRILLGDCSKEELELATKEFKVLNEKAGDHMDNTIAYLGLDSHFTPHSEKSYGNVKNMFIYSDVHSSELDHICPRCSEIYKGQMQFLSDIKSRFIAKKKLKNERVTLKDLNDFHKQLNLDFEKLKDNIKKNLMKVDKDHPFKVMKENGEFSIEAIEIFRKYENTDDLIEKLNNRFSLDLNKNNPIHKKIMEDIDQYIKNADIFFMDVLKSKREYLNLSECHIGCISFDVKGLGAQDWSARMRELHNPKHKNIFEVIEAMDQAEKEVTHGVLVKIETNVNEIMNNLKKKHPKEFSSNSHVKMTGDDIIVKGLKNDKAKKLLFDELRKKAILENLRGVEMPTHFNNGVAIPKDKLGYFSGIGEDIEKSLMKELEKTGYFKELKGSGTNFVIKPLPNERPPGKLEITWEVRDSSKLGKLKEDKKIITEKINKVLKEVVDPSNPFSHFEVSDNFLKMAN